MMIWWREEVNGNENDDLIKRKEKGEERRLWKCEMKRREKKEYEKDD